MDYLLFLLLFLHNPQIRKKKLETAATVRKTTRTIYEDEKLAKEVRKCSCLYNKTDKGCKERDRIKNTWKVVEEALLYEEDNIFLKRQFKPQIKLKN